MVAPVLLYVRCKFHCLRMSIFFEHRTVCYGLFTILHRIKSTTRPVFTKNTTQENINEKNILYLSKTKGSIIVFYSDIVTIV